MRRAVLYCVVSALLLTVYGTQVCPFLDGLPRSQLALMVATALAVMVAARPLLLRRRVQTAPPEELVRRQLHVDLGSFLAVGAGLTIYDFAVHHFPIASGLKLLIGCAMLGMFYALDLALQTERELVADAARRGHRLPARWQLRSLTRGFAVVAILVLGLLGAIFFLIISKDLAWLSTVAQRDLQTAQRSILREVVFVVAVMVALSTNLTLSYARNLQIFFGNQTQILDRIAQGQLESYVPVVGRNEFALIADHTNQMIDSLREKRRVESVLGKVVSPEIARRLLSDGPVTLGGTRRHLVILFSDIRSFTTLSESRSPEAVVQLLNTYFAVMVRLVRERGGLVDKFIGDGMLAVFGLDDPVDAASRAVLAAESMLKACADLSQQLGTPLHIGIGIHQGAVVAGNVGAPERLEFTFVGDVVNTASRLESMTKQLGSPLLISQDVRDALSAQVGALPWVHLGEHQPKGKAMTLSLFGLRG